MDSNGSTSFLFFIAEGGASSSSGSRVSKLNTSAAPATAFCAFSSSSARTQPSRINAEAVFSTAAAERARSRSMEVASKPSSSSVRCLATVSSAFTVCASVSRRDAISVSSARMFIRGVPFMAGKLNSAKSSSFSARCIASYSEAAEATSTAVSRAPGNASTAKPAASTCSTAQRGKKPTA